MILSSINIVIAETKSPSQSSHVRCAQKIRHFGIQNFKSHAFNIMCGQKEAQSHVMLPWQVGLTIFPVRTDCPPILLFSLFTFK